jgi:hypothetical protein
MRDMRARPIAPRDELRAFSQRWPGALAEIDRISPEVLDQRIAALDRAIETGEAPTWARAWILTHRRLRGALAIKAWLAGVVKEQDFPPEAALYRARVDEIRSPPKGRIMELVLGEVAQELALDPSTMRDLLMPRGILSRS